MTHGANGHDPADRTTKPTDGPAAPTDEPASTGEPTLADVLDDLAEDYPDVEPQLTSDGVDYLVGVQPFARVIGPAAHFRLRPEIAAAAARTGDTAISHLGPEWVAFSPRTLDQYALDRAQSWFELGHRVTADAAKGPKRH